MSTNNNQLTMKIPNFYHPEVYLEFAGNAPPFLPVLITQPEVIDNGDVVAIKEEEEDDDEEVDNGEVDDCGVDAAVDHEVIYIDETDEEEDSVELDNGHGGDDVEEEENENEIVEKEEDGEEENNHSEKHTMVKTVNNSLKWSGAAALGPLGKDVMVQAHSRASKETPAKKKKQGKVRSPIDRSPGGQLAAAMDIHQKRALIKNFRELSGLTNKKTNNNEE